MTDQPATAACHCGRPVHVYDEPGMEGFTRGLCLECSTVRCDVAPGPCDQQPFSPATKSAPMTGATAAPRSFAEATALGKQLADEGRAVGWPNDWYDGSLAAFEPKPLAETDPGV